MGWSLGRFVWHELLTFDFDASRAFYGALFDWTIQELTINRGVKYATLSSGVSPVGGLAMKAEGDQTPPLWLGYVSVEDVEQSAAATIRTGGRIVTPPIELPGIGRLAMLSDPAGAPIVAWRSNGGDLLPDDPLNPGLFCWDELSVEEPSRVLEFYQQVFAWDAQPSETSGTWLFRASGQPVATLMANEGIGAHWLSHVVVHDLEAAMRKISNVGGGILADEQSVPGSGRFAVISDNIGARLSLFEPRSA